MAVYVDWLLLVFLFDFITWLRSFLGAKRKYLFSAQGSHFLNAYIQQVSQATMYSKKTLLNHSEAQSTECRFNFFQTVYFLKMAVIFCRLICNSTQVQPKNIWQHQNIIWTNLYSVGCESLLRKLKYYIGCF